MSNCVECGKAYRRPRGDRYNLCPCHAAYRRGRMLAKKRQLYAPTNADETEGREALHKARTRALREFLK